MRGQFIYGVIVDEVGKSMLTSYGLLEETGGAVHLLALHSPRLIESRKYIPHRWIMENIKNLNYTVQVYDINITPRGYNMKIFPFILDVWGFMKNLKPYDPSFMGIRRETFVEGATGFIVLDAATNEESCLK